MKSDKHQHGHGKHMILMLLGCLVPILVIVGLRYFNISSPVLSKVPFFLMILICPLMHLFMMKGMMGHGKDNCHGGSDEDNSEIESSNK